MRRKTFSAVLLIFVPLVAAEAQEVDVLRNLTMRNATATVGNMLKEAAETSRLIPFKGTISGQPDGKVDLRLRLFPDAKGKMFVFEETQTVQVTGEAFSASIGMAREVGIPPAVFASNPSLWVAVSLDSAPDMERGPRQVLFSAGDAYSAPNGSAGLPGPTGFPGPELSPGATISGATTDWIARFMQTGGGSTIQVEQADGSEGDLIRGSNTSRQCAAPLAGRSCSSDPDCIVQGQCRYTGHGANRCRPGDFRICTSDADCPVVQSSCLPPQTAQVFRVAKNGDTFLGGNVGIGTASPAYKLDVGGQIRSGSGGFVFPDGSVQTSAVDSSLATLWTSNGADIYRIGSNVGIGTASPAFRLDVEGTIRTSSRQAISGPPADLLIGTTYPECVLPPCPPPSTSFRVDGFGKLGVGGYDPSSGYPAGWEGGLHAFDIFAEGSVGLGRDGVWNAVIGSDGVGTFKIVHITGGADLSEQFDVVGTPAGNVAVREQVTPGMVVSIDPDNPGSLAICTHAYDRRVAGIISGAGGVQPGMLLGQAGTLADGQHPVALTGRVYVWADASSGAIVPGDLLTTANLPGHAMKVTDHGKAQGAILGKAMTGLKEGTGLVLVLVTLQ